MAEMAAKFQTDDEHQTDYGCRDEKGDVALYIRLTGINNCRRQFDGFRLSE